MSSLAELRAAVAAAKGIPSRHAHRLQGTTQAELEADADALVAEMAPATPVRLELDEHGQVVERRVDMGDVRSVVDSIPRDGRSRTTLRSSTPPRRD